MIASAPGKLFLLGEYAVLEGAPAIVATVKQRARVEVTSGKGNVLMKTGSTTSASVSSVAIIQAATRVLTTRGVPLPDLNTLDFDLDTSAFFRGNEKLGLGSSAALTVALVRALARLPVNADSLALAMACHQEFQGGIGSGADIAAALVGGCIRFVPGQFPCQCSLPGRVQVRFVWTGKGAGTVPYLTRLDEWRGEHRAAYAARLNTLSQLAEQGIDACRNNDADLFIETVTAYDAALRQLSESSSTGFYTEVHCELARLAAQTRCSYKPSGAGGGDFGVAYATSADQIRAFESVAQDHGFDTTIASMSPALNQQESP